MTLVQIAASLGWWLVVVIPAFLLVLTLIVFVHELGHFMMGRVFGVKIDSFSIGFGRAIAGFHDRHGTHWKIGWIPLGGYVKFWGDAGVSSNPDHEVVDRATPQERAQSFHHKPLYQKSLIAAAGPIANFILAIAIFSVSLMVIGDVAIVPQIGRVMEKSPAEAAGFKIGDRVLAIDGRQINSFTDIMEIVSLSGDRPLAFRVARGGQDLTIKVTPAQMDRPDGLGNSIKDSMVGIGPVSPTEVASVVAGSPAAQAGLKSGDLVVRINNNPIDSFDDIATTVRQVQARPIEVQVVRDSSIVKVAMTPQAITGEVQSADDFVTQALGLIPKNPGSPKIVTEVRVGPVEALSQGCQRTWFIAAKSLGLVGQLLTGTGDYRQLSGPIGIAKVSGQILDKWGPGALIGLIAVLSVSIGLLNLFPIPMLDGGHLLYYGIEAVRGRPLGEKAQELGFQIGLVLVVGLMLIATWNDLLKFRLF
jgi:regulator of sigma E protease